MTQGYKWEQNRGLIALGLFKDEAEIASSPTQYGQELMPGDIKYKDVNGDGVINDDDIVPIGHSNTPEIVYGLGLSAQWKNFDFSVLFQGSGRMDFIMEGYTMFPFVANDAGNILSAVADPKNRWISREISGDPATERQDAIFASFVRARVKTTPNGQHGGCADGHYLRLKNLEIGYTLSQVFDPQITNGEIAHLPSWVTTSPAGRLSTGGTLKQVVGTATSILFSARTRSA